MCTDFPEVPGTSPIQEQLGAPQIPVGPRPVDNTEGASEMSVDELYNGILNGSPSLFAGEEL